MLHIISPAKTLDFDTPAITPVFSQPQFLAHSQELINDLRKLTPTQVSALMSISEKLGELNTQRFAQWRAPFTPDNAKQALLAFKGDVYTGMAADTFSSQDFTFAQQHLRILSGLYGLLKPLDLIQPYRLEMGTRFANPRGHNLYQFWGDSLTQHLNTELTTAHTPVLINLASTEYFSAVNTRKLRGKVITPVFKDQKNGQYKIISFFAKKARGMMSSFIIKNRIQEPEAIKQFDLGGYGYSPQLSSAHEWVFIRPEHAAEPR